MLRSRVLTATVLALLLVLAMYTLPTPWLAAAFAVVVLVGAWEWSRLCGLVSVGARLAFLALIVLCGALGWMLLAHPRYLFWLLGATVLWWLWCFFEVVRIARGAAPAAHGLPYRLLRGTMLLVPTWLALLYLHQLDPARPHALLFVFGLVSSADIGAYAAGAAWGKTKLAPRISPGKSVEGLLGGLTGVAVLALAAGVLVWRFPLPVLIAWVGLCLLTGLFSVVGDLTESMAKREAGVKDSSGLLPGHGGVLDRSDSLTAAAPVFALVWALVQRMV